MPDLKFGLTLLFSGADRLSDTLSSIGQDLMDFGDRAQEAGEKLGSMGERMVGFGERLGLTAALASEGANKLHEWSDALQEPAQDMQKNMATMAAMTGLGSDALDQLKQRAVAFAATHPGTTADEWVTGFTRMHGIFQGTSQAMRAEDITAMLKRLGVDNDATTKLIQVAWSNLRTDSATTGDQLTKAIQTFGLDPAAANQFATAVGWLGASASAAHAPFSEVLALSGEANRLLGGGRGASMFASMIQGLETAAAKGKATIDFSHGLVAALQQLKSQLSGTPTDRLADLAEMGLSGQGPQLLKLLDNLDEVAQKQKQIGDSSGVLSKAYGTATANMADATQRLHQNWSNLAEGLSSPVLGIQARATNLLSDAVQDLSKHIENHSKIAAVAAIALTGLGGAAYHGVQALSAFGTISIFAGEGLQAAQWAIKALDFESIALRFMYAKDAIAGIVSATNLWTGAQSLLNAALAPTALTIGAIVVGVAALAVAVNEIYEHWSAVKGFFVKLWDDVKVIFADAAEWMKNAGENLVKAPGEGILAGIEYPFKAAAHVAEKIGGFFHFRSPPAYGPLREAIVNFRFGEELAKHMKPAPAIAASIGMAAGIAAAPMIYFPFGELVQPAASAVAAPHSPFGAAPTGIAAAASAFFLSFPRVSGARGIPEAQTRDSLRQPRENHTQRGGITINVNYSPTINGGTRDDWVKAARQHADELMRIIDSKLNRRNRLEFA